MPKHNSSSTKKDNVSVVLRCRPQNRRELRGKDPVIVSCDSNNDSVMIQTVERNTKQTKKFNFDKVFGQYSTQKEVYQTVVAPVVHEVLEGFNCTVFAYGQTGTGKTHTMEGDLKNQEMKGIIPRAVEHIFETLNTLTKDMEYSVKISFLELYNEQLDDLLVASETKHAPELRLCEDKKRGVLVQNLENVLVNDPKDIYEKLEEALQKRKVSETKMNKQSSRSHTIFTMMIHIKETTPEGEDLLKVGKLNLVDLAGSECVGRSGATGDRKREAGNINQSLLTLGRVISALVEKRGHIPYRDSKLTRLLQESLGGKAKTTIIATISPSGDASDETLSTLSYASRAKSIENRPEINQRMTKKTLIKEYSGEITRIKEELKAAREKNGVFLPKDRYDEMISEIETKGHSIAELEAALERRQAEFKEIQEKFGITKHELEETKGELLSTQNELKDTTLVLDDREAVFGKLSVEATAAVTTGEEAVSDVSQLHEKVARKAAVVDSNRNRTTEFVRTVQASVEKIQSSCTEASKKDLENDQIVMDKLKTLEASSNEYSKALHDKLGALEGKFQDFNVAFNDRATSRSEAFFKSQDEAQRLVLEAVESIRALVKERDDRSADLITEQKDAIGASMKHRSDYFSSMFQPSLEAMQKSVDAFSVEIVSKMESTFAANNQHVECVEETIGSFSEQAKSASDEFKAEQTKRFQEHKENEEKERAAMMKKMQAMFLDFSSKQTDRFQNFMEHAQKHEEVVVQDIDGMLATHKASTETMKSEAGANKKVMENAVKAFSDATAKNFTSFKESADEYQKGASDSENAMVAAFDSFSKENVNMMKTFGESVQSFHTTVETETGTAKKEAIAFHEGSVEMVKEHGDSMVSDDLAYIKTSITDGTEFQATWGTETTAHVEAAMVAKRSSEEELVSISTVAKEASEAFEKSLERDIATGRTPQKKEYIIPKQLASLNPRDIVLQNLKRSLNVSEGGDELPLAESPTASPKSTVASSTEEDSPKPEDAPKADEKAVENCIENKTNETKKVDLGAGNPPAPEATKQKLAVPENKENKPTTRVAKNGRKPAEFEAKKGRKSAEFEAKKGRKSAEFEAKKGRKSAEFESKKKVAAKTRSTRSRIPRSRKAVLSDKN